MVWETVFYGNSNTYLQKVFTDKYSNVFWVSNIFSPINFVEEVTGESGGACIAKFDQNGNYSWSRAINGYLWSFVVEKNGYLLANYSRDSHQGFLIIDPEGEVIMDQTSDSIRFQQFSLDPYGNVYYSGSMLQELTIDGETIPLNSGENYVFGSLKSFWLPEFTGETTEQLVKGMIPFPIPANQYITLELPEGQNARIIIYDIHGRQQMKCNLPGGTNELNISKIAPGIHLLGIKSGPYFWSHKIIIE